MSKTEILITAAITLLIIWFSWYISIREKRFHGIWRFFSFESILMLVMLNYTIWFSNPFSVKQIISWLLLILSLLMALIGFGLLTRKGKAEGTFENTTELITSGIYHYIRHPLYLSLFLLGTGAMMKDPRIPQVLLGAVNAIAVYLTARAEEKEMYIRFGSQYKEYCKRTKMFIPYIF